MSVGVGVWWRRRERIVHVLTLIFWGRAALFLYHGHHPHPPHPELNHLSVEISFLYWKNILYVYLTLLSCIFANYNTK